MPVDMIVNPAGTEGEASPDNGIQVEYYVYDSSQSGNLVNGTLVSLESLTAPSTGPVLIKKSTTTADFLVLGVVVNAPTGGYTPGSVVAVQTQGVCLALFDAHNTTAGHLALQSVTTAGSLVDSAAATLGQTLGVILESVTISSGTALVPIRLSRM